MVSGIIRQIKIACNFLFLYFFYLSYNVGNGPSVTLEMGRKPFGMMVLKDSVKWVASLLMCVLNILNTGYAILQYSVHVFVWGSVCLSICLPWVLQHLRKKSRLYSNLELTITEVVSLSFSHYLETSTSAINSRPSSMRPHLLALCYSMTGLLFWWLHRTLLKRCYPWKQVLSE